MTTNRLHIALAVSVCLLVFAIVMTYWIRPHRPIAIASNAGGMAMAGK